MKPFVIVIEGTDKCGKTSLARMLNSELGWPIVKCSQPEPGVPAVDEYLNKLAVNSGPFIADRFHLGESVYGPLYRGTRPLSDIDVRAIEEELLDRGSLLVLMEDLPDRIIARFEALGEDFAQARHVSHLLVGFDREWRRSRLAKMRVRWDDDLVRALAIREMIVAVARMMGAK